MNPRITMRCLFLVVLLALVVGVTVRRGVGAGAPASGGAIKLPAPCLKGAVSLEETLHQRRSVRAYGTRPLKLDEVSQVLWAAQGITSKWGGRTAPSAGALYPIELFLVASSVDSLSPGIYRYLPAAHSIELLRVGDIRDKLAAAAMNQSCVRRAPACIVIAGTTDRMGRKYGKRAQRYVDIEVGCVCQNVYLQCETLRLGTVAVGAFNGQEMTRVLGIQPEPLLLMPLGAPTR